MTSAISRNKKTSATVIVAQDGTGDFNGSTGTTIQAALTKVNSLGGGTVVIKRGTYTVSSQISVYANTVIVGEGDATLIKPNGNFYCFYLNGIDNATIQSLKIDGTDVTTYTTAMSIRLYNCTNVKIERCTIVNNKGFGVMIASGGAVTQRVWVTDCYLTGVGNNDVIGGGTDDSTTGYVDNIFIEGNYVEQNVGGAGSYYNAVDIVGVRHTQFNNNKVKGGCLFGTEQYPNRFSKITGNIIEQATGSTTGTYLAVLTNSSVASGSNISEHNIIVNNIIDAGYISVQGVAAGYAAKILISNNTIKTAASTNRGIELSYVTLSDVIANIVQNPTNGVYTSNCSYLNISNNMLIDCTNGINQSSTTNSAYLDNLFYNCATADHANIDKTTCYIRQVKGLASIAGDTIPATPNGLHAWYGNNDTYPTLYAESVSTNHGLNFKIGAVLASNKNGMQLWSDNAQTTGNGLLRLRLGSSSSTIPCLKIEHVGTGAGAQGLNISMNAATQDAISTNGRVSAAAVSCSPTISSGAVAPATTPTKIGDVFVDTVLKKVYFATGTSSSADWTVVN